MSSNFKYVGTCAHKCTDVPFLQYDKDGPRRIGPLIQHLETLMARHASQVDSIENLAIDLLSLACEQVCLCAPGADCWLFSGVLSAACAAVDVCVDVSAALRVSAARVSVPLCRHGAKGRALGLIMLACIVAAHEDDNPEVGGGVEAPHRTRRRIFCAPGAQVSRERGRASVSCKCKSLSADTAPRCASALCARRLARARGSTTAHGESIHGESIPGPVYKHQQPCPPCAP